MTPPTAPAALIRAAQPFIAALIAAVVVQYLMIPHIGGYAAELLVDCGIAVILAVSLTAVNGFTGQFSIGHAGFMAVGGYMAAALVYYGSFRIFGDFAAHPGWKGEGLFAGACLTGGLLAAAFGWIVGLPSLRLRGDYLAIVTLGFGEIVRVIIQGTSDQLDASSVQPAINDLSFPNLLTHLGNALGFSGQPVYTTPFWVWFAATLTVLLTIRLKYSGYGRALLSIREDDIAAQMVGVNTTRLKVRAFMYSAFFAGIGGGLYAMKIGSTINAADFGFQRSFDYVIMVVLGGLGSISGATIAAIVLTLLPELLRGFDMYRMIIYALMLIVIMIVRPQGLLGQGEIWDRLFRRRKRA